MLRFGVLLKHYLFDKEFIIVFELLLIQHKICQKFDVFIDNALSSGK